MDMSYEAYLKARRQMNAPVNRDKNRLRWEALPDEEKESIILMLTRLGKRDVPDSTIVAW